jgi:hypothetical protein
MSAERFSVIVWDTLNALQRATVLQRPVQAVGASLRENVARLIDQVRADGDNTLARPDATLRWLRVG